MINREDVLLQTADGVLKSLDNKELSMLGWNALCAISKLRIVCDRIHKNGWSR